MAPWCPWIVAPKASAWLLLGGVGVQTRSVAWPSKELGGRALQHPRTIGVSDIEVPTLSTGYPRTTDTILSSLCKATGRTAAATGEKEQTTRQCWFQSIVRERELATRCKAKSLFPDHKGLVLTVDCQRLLFTKVLQISKAPQRRSSHATQIPRPWTDDDLVARLAWG